MLLLSLLIPLLLGLAITNTLVLQKNVVSEWLLSLSLAFPAGAAVTSGLYFLYLQLHLPSTWRLAYLLLELTLTGLLAVAWIYRFPKRLPRLALPAKTVVLWITVVAILVFLLYLGNFLDDYHRATLAEPDGDWDAWAIWNLRARFLSSGQTWEKGLSSIIGWSHVDYPLLLPGFVARGWYLVGDTTQALPAIVNLAFLLSILATLVTGVTYVRGVRSGVFAGLFALPVLTASLGMKQLADAPLAFYFLAANLCLYLAGAHPERPKNWFYLAGLMSGAAAWTKNEGLVMLVLTIGVQMAAWLLLQASRAQVLQGGSAFMLGMLPMVAVLAIFKMMVPATDLFANSDLAAVIPKLADLSRYGIIASRFWSRALDTWTLKAPFLPLLVVYVWAAGAYLPPSERPAWTGLVVRIGLLLTAYFLVYLLTPYDLDWHLETSLARLFVHVLPSLILAAMILSKEIPTSDK